MTLLGQRTAVWRAGSVSCDAFPCLASWLWREGTKEPNARSTFNPKPGIQFKPVSIQLRLGCTVTKVSWQKIGFKSLSQTYHQLSSIHFFTSTKNPPFPRNKTEHSHQSQHCDRQDQDPSRHLEKAASPCKAVTVDSLSPNSHNYRKMNGVKIADRVMYMSDLWIQYIWYILILIHTMILIGKWKVSHP